MDELNKDFLFRVAQIAEEAGVLIMGYFRTFYETKDKADGSIVTQADHEADALICKGLRHLLPGVPVISEEGTQEKVDAGSPFWLVDPLDGTKQFVRWYDEFTVNIALIQNRTPVLGVIYHPPSQQMLAAYGTYLFEGRGCVLREVKVPPQAVPVVVIGHEKERGEKFQTTLKQYHLTSAEVKVVRSSLKFCVMAKGEACFQYRARPSYEWDTAAGHALIKARGGKVLTFQGDDLIYGKEDYENPGFIALLS